MHDVRTFSSAVGSRGGIFAASLVALYLILGLVVTGDVPSAGSFGLYGGLAMAVGAAVLVFAWRGVRNGVGRRS